MVSIFNNNKGPSGHLQCYVDCSVTMEQYLKHKIERIRIYKLKHLREI